MAKKLIGTDPSIVASNGSAAFTVNVGTGGTASTGVIGLPPATTGWACRAEDLTTSMNATVQTATTATTVSFINYERTAGKETAWTASDILSVVCVAY